jgi:hypothetical protein
MKNKEFYDLSKIHFSKSSKDDKPIWKIYYSDRDDYWEEEPIETIKRNYINRVKDWGKWCESEHENKFKFSVGDYVFDTNCKFGVITSYYRDNRNNICMYNVNCNYNTFQYMEDELTLSPLDKAEYDFLQYQINHIVPKIDCIVRSRMLNGNIIQLYSDKLCVCNFRFKNEQMYKGMKNDKLYKLPEIGLKIY